MKKTANTEMLSMSDSAYLKSALLLNSIGQEPITINRAFVDLTGNVLSALWLSYALERPRSSEDDTCFEIIMSSSSCARDTGLTRAQQQTCRRTLVDLGILQEDAGQGRVITYRIFTSRLLDLLKQQAMPLAKALRQAGAVASPSPAC